MEVVSEFSAAWCLSIVGRAIPFHSTFVLENGIHGDEKELKKANLHVSNGIFQFQQGKCIFQTVCDVVVHETFIIRYIYMIY